MATMRDVVSLPTLPATVSMTSWRVRDCLMSLVMARMMRAVMMKTSRTPWTNTAAVTPPAVSKALGKLRSPAPRAALTMRKTVERVDVEPEGGSLVGHRGSGVGHSLGNIYLVSSSGSSLSSHSAVSSSGSSMLIFPLSS